MTTPPAVSVVIPVYNDAAGLRETLGSVTTQTVADQRYEILVVDNGSTDATPEVTAAFEERHPELVVGLEENDIQSSYAARNTGIERASGELIVFLDADMTVPETWLADIYDAFAGTSVDYLGYSVELYFPNDDHSLWGRYDAAMGLPVGHYVRTKAFAPTCAMAVRPRVFDDVGPFDESLISGGDKEFGRRVHRAGFEMRYDDSITVFHPARTTFRAHLHKARRIGRGQVQLWDRHDLAPHPLSPVRLLPPSPRRIRERSRAGVPALPLWYLLAYLFKLVQTAAAIDAWRATRTS